MLQFIDRENPSASKLLTAAARPHGTVQHAIFGERQAAQYQHLRGLGQSDRGAGGDGTARLGRAPRPGRSRRAARARLRRDGCRKSRESTSVDRRRRGGRTPRDAGAPGKAAKDAAPASFDQPADPYDPEVFNRRYGPKK